MSASANPARLGRRLLALLALWALLAPLAAAALTATATTLASSVNPSIVSQTTTLTATVSPANATGTVTFKDGSTTLGTATLSGGKATLSKSFTTTGAHSLKATYAGGGSFAGSTSATQTQTVNPKTSSQTVLTSSSNPAASGQAVTLSAHVTGTTPSGTVTFKDGATTLGSAALAGSTATLTRTFSGAASHTLTAAYAGDALNTASTSAALVQTVGKANATVVLASNPNPSTVDGPVDLTATVTGSNPTGTVTFMDGGDSIGVTLVIAGAATLSTQLSTAGTHSLSASYAGNAANNPGTSAVLNHMVLQAQSSVVLSSSANPSGTGQTTTLSASVSGQEVTGTVTFLDGAAVLGAAAVDGSGIANLGTSFNSTGPHALTAQYSGDANNTGSVSPALTQAVKLAAAVAITSTVNPALAGQSTILTATVVPPTASGTITFAENDRVLGTAPLVSGVAQFTTALMTAGNSFMSARYSGDATYLPDAYATLWQIVDRGTPVATLSATPSDVPFGTPVTLTATVAGAAPSGTVAFLDGPALLTTVALTSGQAMARYHLNSVGQHALTAVYSGDANNLGATSAAAAVRMNGTGASVPNPATRIYGYDPEGHPTQEIDPRGVQTTRGFDSLGRPTQETLPAPSAAASAPVVTLGYDGQSQLTGVTDARALVTTYTVNGLAQVTAQSSPDAGTSSATHDEAGNVLTRTDARGKVTTYTYDALNRMTRASYASGVATQFEYDGGTSPKPYSTGRLTRITDESGTTAFEYDAHGRVSVKTQTVGSRAFTVNYGWGSTGSATGRLASVSYPSGARVNYRFDASGRITSIDINPVDTQGQATDESRTLNLLGALTYSGANDVTGWTWGDGTGAAREFDALGRLSSYPLGAPDGTGAAAGCAAACNTTMPAASCATRTRTPAWRSRSWSRCSATTTTTACCRSRKVTARTAMRMTPAATARCAASARRRMRSLWRRRATASAACRSPAVAARPTAAGAGMRPDTWRATACARTPPATADG